MCIKISYQFMRETIILLSIKASRNRAGPERTQPLDFVTKSPAGRRFKNAILNILSIFCLFFINFLLTASYK